ncbi:MAG TPA: SsrA-binding protein SmpB [Candidatus Saccharimonadales bacterium]|nr:SsrA-binding protein SmpB [Candidatus Saccharimonadales bacterium]
MAKKPRRTGTITNKRARYDYQLGDILIVGMQLNGAETKALRLGHGQLRGAYVTEKNSELWLINAQITGDRGIAIDETTQTRSRKLLAKRAEIDKLIQAKAQGMTIVPLEVLNRGRYIKLKIALGRGKKRYDKRETLKRRQQEREIARESRL